MYELMTEFIKKFIINLSQRFMQVHVKRANYSVFFPQLKLKAVNLNIQLHCYCVIVIL